MGRLIHREVVLLVSGGEFFAKLERRVRERIGLLLFAASLVFRPMRADTRVWKRPKKPRAAS